MKSPVVLSMICLGALLTLSHGSAWAEKPNAKERQLERREVLRELDRNTQIIKETTLDLEYALYRLELDQTMDPLTESRWFFKVENEQPYVVQNLNISLNGTPWQQIKYSEAEAAALHNNGADRFFHNNLATGQYQITVQLEGYFTQDGRTLQYNTTTNFDWDKKRGLSHVLIALKEARDTWRPKLSVQVWQQ